MLEKIYLNAPVWLQLILINLQGYRIKRRRLNSEYKKYFKFYQKIRYDSVDQAQLRRFLKSSASVSFWKMTFLKYNLNLDADDLTLELKKLPILSKEFVRKNTELFVNKNYVNQAFWSQTSGTTGSPLRFPTTYEMENKLWAIWERNRRLHGITENTWMGWFGGKTIVNINQKKPPYWRTCFPLKQVMFSGYHLNEDTVIHYFNKIKKTKLTWIHSYPSQIALFASLVKGKGLGNLPDLKIITLGSETLLDHQREIIKSAFSNVNIVQHYGQGEGVAVINQDSYYSFYPEQNFSFVEFVNENDSEFKIVGTNYNNLAFPLIRYETGDLCSFDRTGEINSIDGRIEDYVVLPDNTKIGRLDHIFKGLDNIEESQIYQNNKGSLLIRIVKGEGFNEVEDVKALLRSAKERLGNEINIDVEFVGNIPRTKSGKLRFVISDIKE